VLGDRGLGIRLRAEIAFAMTPRMISVSSGEGLRRSLPWKVRVVTSTRAFAGTKRRGLAMPGFRQSGAPVAHENSGTYREHLPRAPTAISAHVPRDVARGG
jgi:hypothetical protein